MKRVLQPCDIEAYAKGIVIHPSLRNTRGNVVIGHLMTIMLKLLFLIILHPQGLLKTS